MINIFLKKRSKLLIAGILVFILTFFIVGTNKAFAINENSSGVPTDIVQGLLNNPNCQTPDGAWHYNGQNNWISLASDTTKNGPVYIGGGVNFVDLSINGVGSNCRRNERSSTPPFFHSTNLRRTVWMMASNARVNNPLLSVTGVIPNSSFQEASYNCSYMFNLRWAKVEGSNCVDEISRTNIRISGLNNLPESLDPYFFNVSVDARPINTFSTNRGDVYVCNVNGQNFGNNALAALANCPTYEMSLPVVVYKLPTITNTSRRYNLTPHNPAISVNGSTASVTFTVTNSGDGTARFKYGGNAGDPSNYILLNSAYYAYVRVGSQIIDSTGEGTISQGRPEILGNGGSWTQTFTIPRVINSGESICARLVVDPATGITDDYPDPSRRESNGGSDVCITAPEISTKPYFRVYGHDVVVGRRFVDPSGVCSPKTSGSDSSDVKAFTMGNGSNTVGAGSQFAVSATGAIEGFMSASMHSGNTDGDEVPKPQNGLSFLNSGNDPSTLIGNDQNAYLGCVPDYESYVNSDGGFSSFLLGSIQSYLNSHDNKLYVNGDLTISGNIEDNTTSWSSIEDINPIIVIVKGNINIASNVSRLDGLYVAIPKSDGSDGEINTCYDLSMSCVNKLTVNGAFVAKKVKLNRLNGDVARAGANELTDSNNIAEVFNFPTEFYLGLKFNINQPPTPTANTKKYDTLVGLPPVL